VPVEVANPKKAVREKASLKVREEEVGEEGNDDMFDK